MHGGWRPHLLSLTEKSHAKRWIVEGSTDPCRAAPVYHRRLWGSFSRLLYPFEANSYMRLATPQGFSGIAISHL